MKKSFIYVSALIFTFLSCSKDENLIVENDAIEFRSVSAITLTVNCLTNRNLNPGNTFIHQIILKNGTVPIPNATVGIDDPIAKICTWVTTNSFGIANWNRTTTSSTPRMAYTVKFYYGGIVKYSTVALNPASSTNLSTYKIDFNSVGSLSSSTLVGASRGDMQNTVQSQNTTLQQGVNLGIAIAKDYLQNPGNLIISTTALVSCSGGLIIPPAGIVACPVAAKLVATGVAASTIKVLTKAAIDRNSQWNSSQKTALKSIVDLSNTAIAVTRLAPAESVKALGNIPTVSELLTTNYGQLITNTSGLLKGASVSVPLSGSDEILNFCFKKP